jgi:acyl carrier protein
MSDLMPQIAELIEQVTDAPAATIGAQSRFEELTNWTSYTALRLLTGIEERTGVRLDLREYFAIQDVGGLLQAVAAARV